ncbi:hypothetical protein [Mycobacterium aquaticum]|uniref:Uncharacterized protein n=1 Tax=Mycobacterium aquaticum TaxID=1927124 RepID=A0A1X0A7H7_9MYCO|nr:hypothetical protein [Mycobacterium aquaticum]ORA26019.1 hypothetical protein BST13_32370 [Mycobacterium aquaticum]
MATPWIMLTAASAVGLTGCALPIAGTATAPRPYSGPVDVTFAYTDSFDVLPGGKCRGRGLFAGVRDGAQLDVVSLTGYGARATATLHVRYEEDPARRQGDDGKFCIARFTFVTPEPPSRVGYVAEHPAGPLPVIGPGVGPTFETVLSACTELNSPPEAPCGYTRQAPR